MERRVLKVLKALAEFKNMTLGDLLEGIVLHAFEGKTAFTPIHCERSPTSRRFMTSTSTPRRAIA